MLTFKFVFSLAATGDFAAGCCAAYRPMSDDQCFNASCQFVTTV